APAHRVSRRAIAYWAVRAAIGWVVLAAVQVVWLIGAYSIVALREVALVVTGVLAVLHLVVIPQWRYRVHRWESTDTAVYTQTGWFTQERRIAPIARVQTVDTQRGPVEQLFGLADVTVTTASAKGPIKIHALDAGVADQIVGWLTERAHRA